MNLNNLTEMNRLDKQGCSLAVLLFQVKKGDFFNSSAFLIRDCKSFSFCSKASRFINHAFLKRVGYFIV